MKYRFDGYNYVVRLDKGELLVESLTKFAREQKLGGAWISGLGGALWAEIGYYHLGSKEYTWRKIDQLLEITALQGNLAWAGEDPVLHLHGTFSDEKMQAFGGHVKELQVGGTCELFLHVIINQQLTRSQSDEIGLKLLDL